MTTQNLKCLYFRLHLCLLYFEGICLEFEFWDLEFSHEIATHLSGARNDKTRTLRMTPPSCHCESRFIGTKQSGRW